MVQLHTLYLGAVSTTAGNSDAAFLRTGSRDLSRYLCAMVHLFSVIMHFKCKIASKLCSRAIQPSQLPFLISGGLVAVLIELRVSR